jgi:uncharacterized membrane protein
MSQVVGASSCSRRANADSPHRGGAPAPTSWRDATGVVVLVLLCIPIALYAFGFQFGALGNPDFHARFATTPVMAAFHVLGGGAALLIGGLQFSSRVRRRAPTLHRWLGRGYLVVVLFGAIGGAALATIATGGLVARVGFFLLAALWLLSGAAAYLAIRAGDVDRHRRWMVRNFALTFAAVTLRVHLPILTAGFGVPFESAYPVVAWLAWVPNLVVAEWLILSPRPVAAAS